MVDMGNAQWSINNKGEMWVLMPAPAGKKKNSVQNFGVIVKVTGSYPKDQPRAIVSVSRPALGDGIANPPSKHTMALYNLLPMADLGLPKHISHFYAMEDQLPTSMSSAKAWVKGHPASHVLDFTHVAQARVLCGVLM